MPSILQEDARQAVVKTDDGRKVTVAKTAGNQRLLDSLRGDAGVDVNAPSTETPAPGEAPGVFKRASSVVQQMAQPEAPGTATPVSAPAQAVAPNTPQSAPASKDVGQVGLEMLGAGFDKQQKGLEQQAKAIDAGATAGAAAAGAHVAAINTYEKAQREAEAATVQDAATRQRLLDQKMADVDSTKKKYVEEAAVNPGRLWGGMQNWQKALAGVSIILGSVSTDPNHVNQGLKAINEAIEQDIKAQQNQRDKLKSDYEVSRTGLEDLRSNFHSQNEEYLFRKQVALDSLSTHLQKIAAQTQGTQISAQAMALRGQLQAASGELQRQQGELYLSTIPSVKDIKPEQWKAGQFAARMQQAEGDFTTLQKRGYNRADFKSSALAAIAPEGMKSEDLKLQEQAEMNFLSAVLRKESGAAISKQEITDGEKQYFPRVSDTRKVIEQKARNRAQATAGLLAEAGTAMRLLPSYVAAPTPQGFTPVSSKR